MKDNVRNFSPISTKTSCFFRHWSLKCMYTTCPGNTVTVDLTSQSGCFTCIMSRDIWNQPMSYRHSQYHGMSERSEKGWRDSTELVLQIVPHAPCATEYSLWALTAGNQAAGAAVCISPSCSCDYLNNSTMWKVLVSSICILLYTWLTLFIMCFLCHSQNSKYFCL